MKDIPARLHSRYNPQAEAARYIDALKLPDSIGCFILIEPGLGYLAADLHGRFPAAKIAALHADSALKDAVIPGAADFPAWYPDSAETAQDFLEGEIPDADAGQTRIIEWRPALGVYGSRYAQLVSEAADFIRRADAGKRTAGAFGKRWVKNFFRNLFIMRRVLVFPPQEFPADSPMERPLESRPVIITGAGPSLEEALSEIRTRQEQEGAFIIAAASSLLALERGGIKPDLAISTDGGAWALTHLRACFRHGQARGLAASLCAAMPSQCEALPLLALNDGTLWQNIALNSLAIPSLALPQRGTVTASAADLALTISSGAVYLAGADLSVRDIKTHARPYGFDWLFSGSATRLRPWYSQIFERSSVMRHGGSHEIYAAWFKKQLVSWPPRVFSLGGGHEVFRTQNAGLGPEKPPARKTARCFREVPINVAAASEKAVRALSAALDDSRFAGTLKNELAPLLFPGERQVSPRDISRMLADIASPYIKAYHG